MSRSIAIALTFSAAAHLAAVGFGPAPATPASQTGAAVLTVRLAQPNTVAPARHVPAPAPRIAAQNAAATPARTARTPVAARALPSAPPAPVAAPVQMPAETPATAVSTVRDQSSSDALQQQIRQLLSGHFHYPRLARQRGWEGVVEVALHVAADGTVSHVVLHRPSGHATLDQAALSAAGQLRSVPEAAARLNGTGLDLVVPVHYRLDGG